MALDTHPTITKLRILSRHQQLLRLDFEEDFQNVECQELLAKLEVEVKNFGALVLSDYGKGTLKDVQKMIQIARKANVPVLIDPKKKKVRFSTLSWCDFTDTKYVRV